MLGEIDEYDVSYTKTVAYRILFPLDEIHRLGVQTDLTFNPHSFVGVNKVRARPQTTLLTSQRPCLPGRPTPRHLLARHHLPDRWWKVREFVV